MIWNTFYAVTSKTVTRETEEFKRLCDQARNMPVVTDEQYRAYCKIKDAADLALEYKVVLEVREIELGTSDGHEGLFMRSNSGDVKQLTGLSQFYAKSSAQMLRKLNGRNDPMSIGGNAGGSVVRWFGTKSGAEKFLGCN